MNIVYAQEKITDTITRSIFLAGPTPRKAGVPSWRKEAIAHFRQLGFEGTIFSPENEGGNWKKNYMEQVQWEEKCLNMADCILFWVPRNLENMPAFTTNTEWGVWCESGKVVFGAPPNAKKIRYQKYYADKHFAPTAETLKGTVRMAISMTQNKATRTGGERDVPLYIWNTPHFQNWYSAQRAAGNRLDGVKVLSVFRTGRHKQKIFAWAMRVNVFVASEDRNKSNEIIFSRPDISSVVLFKKRTKLENTDVIVVREFRSPAANSDCFIRDLPGGSSFSRTRASKEVAVQELLEETGFTINPDRLIEVSTRQLLGTFLTHKGKLFMAEINDAELKYFKDQCDTVHGEANTSERTFVEVVKYRDLLNEDLVDWSTLGMISAAILKSRKKSK